MCVFFSYEKDVINLRVFVTAKSFLDSFPIAFSLNDLGTKVRNAINPLINQFNAAVTSNEGIQL